ncbi:hypothetical protein FisN_10Lu394 [Fistulifera solaris]|uniref:Uncharacterized protein n=1 Tax=Fistulifera solaris TaxID=1519565 RepID=A0A1Z5JUH0_FISSO|nr:hypothetical protein FisN_10Lu394 [Fistulifera solaris]|eukprot:GAX17677.1 hypothetical protein FisN_10Lu394 [Fistulifera solaris]
MATFLWSLQDSGGLYIRGRHLLDWKAFQPKQWRQILQAQPALHLQTGTWTPAQSRVLAMYASCLHFGEMPVTGGEVAFHDDGMAFVQALAKRKTPFRCLSVQTMPWSHENLRRLLQQDIFEKLVLPKLEEKDCVLLPLSTKVDALNYTIDAALVQPEDFVNLDIAARHLTIRFFLLYAGPDWGESVASFLKRVAELGHFEHLCIKLTDLAHRRNLEPAETAQALVDVIRGNRSLKHLDLSGLDWMFSLDVGASSAVPPMKQVWDAIEEHSESRTVTLGIYSPDRIQRIVEYASLERLLSRNRNVTVIDKEGKRISNGSTIDKLYALNSFYNGSTDLI